MNYLKQLFIKKINFRQLHVCRNLKNKDIYEPSYLDSLKPKVPLYNALNIQLRGYDYPILENYQKFIHNLAHNLEINVEDAWATPAQDLQVTTLKPKSEIPNTEYKLKIYERNVQVTDLTSLQLPILLRAIESSTPSGVTVTVMPHEDWHEDIRYIPDNELKVLKQTLDDLRGPVKKK